MARDILTSLRGERNITRLYAPFLLVSFIFFHWVFFSFNRPPWNALGTSLEYAYIIRIGYGVAFATYLLSLATEFPHNRNFSLLCVLATWAILLRHAFVWGVQKYEMHTATNGWEITPAWAFYLSFNTLLAASILSVLRFPKHPASEE
jgi:hypothetical protein